ncbi:DNA-binding protein SMUBP-2 [Phlebotomus argentipes]|uniref:DNA-binding protein SMUBP-2 n=1 Tax=Phlebotomus argentipes TaxID=94469 RepID=UPI002892EE22|nr:DNA-binding protein SMUBP-2 [Phlebotomus argentipes]
MASNEGGCKKKRQRKKKSASEVVTSEQESQETAFAEAPGQKMSNPILETYRPGVNDSGAMVKEIPTDVVNKNLTDVLDSVHIIDSLCDYKTCKQKTSLMGQDCDYCRKRFCFKHGLPEVHGCGEAIKKDERKKFLHPVPEKTRREAEDLAKLHVKLKENLKDMQKQRLAKPPKDTKGKSKKS